nr:IS3 family transposase [Dubosiella newyorkensis]
MSRKGNCWDNAPQESFFGHMKDEIREKLKECSRYEEVKALLDEQIRYYNTERYQWKLAKLSPNEYYQYVTTQEYPIQAQDGGKTSNGR